MRNATDADTPSQPKRAAGRRSAKESQATLDQLLLEAEKLFAQRGFAGTSVRDLSAALGIAGSTVLHHVGSKRKLYAAVLERIALSSMVVLQHIDESDPATVMRQFAERFMLWVEMNPDYTHIMLREMMENQPRLNEAHHWHLATFLDSALKLTTRTTKRLGRSAIAPDMLLMILLGAIHYFHVALPTFVTLRGEQMRDVKRRFVDTLDSMLQSSVR